MTTWRRRVKIFFKEQIRQVPCLHAIVQPVSKCFKGRQYETLGQNEEGGEGGEPSTSAVPVDERQNANALFGQTMTKVGAVCVLGLSILLASRNANYEESEFSHDAPLVLYLGAFQLLVCGACAQTASEMYKRRRHAFKHPADSTERERRGLLKVELEKEPGMENSQLYGLGFRPSTDGLECLVVEGVRRGSILDQWNNRKIPEIRREGTHLTLAAIEEGGHHHRRDGPDGIANGAITVLPPDGLDDIDIIHQAHEFFRPRQKVHPFSVIVAVNDVSADVGMMQCQLMRPKVTLWVRSEIFHASRLEFFEETSDGEAPPAAPHDAASASRASAVPVAAVTSNATNSSIEPQPPALASPTSAPVPVFLGRPEADMDHVIGVPVGLGVRDGIEFCNTLDPSIGPHCCCLGLEDEEPQILARWCICAIIFGWVTLLPVLLMQPHEERPRQQLFRQYLLKPCLFVLPIWVLMWCLDCVELLFQFSIFKPFWYFSICHVALPAVLVWYLFQMQQADERLVLEQRESRNKEAGPGAEILVIEDPQPTMMKELIMINPVALLWLGSCASLPVLISSLLTPLTTERGRMAQGYANLIYGPLVFAQVILLIFMWSIRFSEMPKLYVAGFGLLLSVPCFLIWCMCLMCSSRYGRQDMLLVARQRLERGKAVKDGQVPQATTGTVDVEQQQEEPGIINDADVVDCTEAHFREWELIYTA